MVMIGDKGRGTVSVGAAGTNKVQEEFGYDKIAHFSNIHALDTYSWSIVVKHKAILRILTPPFTNLNWL